ncbi:MAG: alpha/beta hydrolase [Deltaproteobacteria bacterium]|nr:alpha/beta hydrolase [Deltaproteobacteria bacterium]MBW1816413.1 alpha/beta hydrolase [Deltaproteobacteria bacterium]MBW2284636.1 alpha/beta hydrolase [Deltaproteobacteria bacterium]
MIDLTTVDYSALDRPEILMFLFHPRPEWEGRGGSPSAKDVMIPVGDDAVIGGRFHVHDKASPSILFFHGNGEIVSDYDEMGPMYNQTGMNFLAVDYRGYGRSTGRPTVTAMMRDCHVIYDFSKGWLAENGCTGPFIVMGRSLGSASALELVRHYGEAIDGLIVESGFAFAGPLLRLLGIDPDALGFTEAAGFGNVDKIRAYDKPTLVIHAEFDHIIPFSDGQALYDASPAEDKTLLKIPGANHNDIFMRGLREYMAAVKSFSERVK